MRLASLVLLLAACSAARTATAGITFGSYFETHMAEKYGVTEHGELHRRLHEHARKVQAEAEAVAASGKGTSEYLEWRRRLSAERGRSLEVATISSGTSSFVPPPLNSPPGPGDINITIVRHGSVFAPPFVDWRLSTTVNTPVFDQKACESCWLWAAADIISMKWALLSHFLTPVPVSPQHVCDCGFRKCCGGGWPEWTFSFARMNRGVAPLASYPYQARDYQTCQKVNTSLLTGKITGWEKLPAYNPVALIKTISQHPAVVLIQATGSFAAYRGGVWMGSDCPRRATVNHAVVVMGYNATAEIPHWIAKNTWGDGWGEGGYIRIAMVSRICGFGSEPSLYPTMFRVKTPCDAVPPPCGNGTCYMAPDGYTARCLCPAGFVEKLEDNAPKCAVKTPCSLPVNPCAFGTCSDEFDGTYTCWCPPGTVVGSRADGAETCIVNSVQSGLLTTTTVPGDNCTNIAVTYNVTLSTLLIMNPFLNCTATLAPGLILVVGGAEKGVGCAMTDVVGPGDTCPTIAARNNITVSQLLTVNPNTTCTSLLLSQHLCVQPGQFASVSPYERSCGATYTTDFDDTCLSIAFNYTISLTFLEWLNPGLDCTAPNLGMTTVCIAPLDVMAYTIQCNQWYNITQADTCWSVASNAGLSLDDFLTINPGVRCLWPNWVVGLGVCINGTAADAMTMTLPPNLKPYNVRTNDTLLSIATRFSYSGCAQSDGTPATVASLVSDICWANGWYPNCNDRQVSVASVIFIPCLNQIGAVACAGSVSPTTDDLKWYWCGSDGRTYASYSCASAAMATPGGGYGSCTTCSWVCTGIAGLSPQSYWGSTGSSCRTLFSTVCPLPPLKADAAASQICTTFCEYSRLICGAVSGPAGCTNFGRCMSNAASSASQKAGWCPMYTTLRCANTTAKYDSSICNLSY